MHVIGTAGHVDHGKSTLIEALTGINPDRLKEERDREMTIDLGFAWMQMPDGEMVGIVDVPGHRDFIENMLAGVGGVDAVLLAVAADEGVMPQTREHLAILNLLQVHGGVIVMTKLDLVHDPEWLDLVEAEIRQTVAGTVLEGATIIRVSARSGEGLPALTAELARVLAESAARPDLGRPRLPVDRVFSLPGFGTIVTGTLNNGRFSVGDEVEILPAHIRTRIRGLQNYNRKETTALPGSRTAINLPGVEVSQIERGAVVAHPGSYPVTRWLDVHFRLLPDVKNPLKHNDLVKIFIGTAEIQARVRLLGADEIIPGEMGWLQLELNFETTAMRGDRFILRRPSPAETLGGGVIVDALPGKRHKRFDPEIISRLEITMRGEQDDLLLAAIQSSGPSSLAEIKQTPDLDSTDTPDRLAALVQSGRLVDLGRYGTERFLATPDQWRGIQTRCVDKLEDYHRANPQKKGMPREELKTRLRLSAPVFQACITKLAAASLLVEEGLLLRRPAHKVRLDPVQSGKAEQLLACFASNPYSPPGVKESQSQVGEAVFEALVNTGRLTQVSEDVVFAEEIIRQMERTVHEEIEENGGITVSGFRDRFHTSRKYALAFLEYLDRKGITQRAGDSRVLKR
jgi:selenocysteine-specific elongation factor